MLFDHHSIARIRDAIRKDPYAANSFELLKKDILSVDYTFVQEKHKLLLELNHRAADEEKAYYERTALTRELSELSVNASFLYLLEPDSSLLPIVKGLISAVCSADSWSNLGPNFKVWKSDLTTADIGVHIAIALENIKAQMPEEYIQEVTSTLLHNSFYPLYEEWLSPENHVNALDTMGHNWWNVCISGMGVVLLTAGKSRVPQFDSCLDQIMDSLREWMNYPGNTLQNKKANFGSDGDYIEYVGYFMYAFSNYCIFNEMLKKDDRLDALDFSESEEKTADFYSSFFHRLWDGPRLADFGDISLQVEKHSQYIFYLCGKFNKSWTQENFKQLNARLALPYEFYFYNPDIASSGWLPPREKIFHDSGYAIIRSGFTADDTSFMMKTGESWNHNHDDAGTFELACRGQLFITDSGNCSYGDPNYVQYYIKPQAHNVIHFNGGQEPDDIRYHGTKYMGNFPAFLSTETYKYLLADCAGPFINQFQRYYRHVIFIKDMIVMIDDLFTYEEGNLHYNLHVNGKVELDANLAVLTSHGVQLEIHSLFPRNKEWQLQSGYAHEIKNGGSAAPVQPEVEYLQISTPTEKRREKFIHCFKLPSGSASEVRVTADEGEWAKEVVIEREDGTERIICNMRADGRVMHQNSSLTYKNIETDAFIIYIKSSHDGKILQVAQHNGSLLKIDGICYISSMLKNDSLLNLEDGSITVHNTSDASCYFKTSPDNQAQPGKFKLKAGTSTLKI